MSEFYTEYTSRAVDTNEEFKHVMAITLDPRTGNKEGIIRCVKSRTGNLEVKGYVDRSELHKISGDSLEHFEVGERLEIKNESEIINGLLMEGEDFFGLEDPDIWIDEKNNLLHIYFTIPIRTKDRIKTHLGHAVGVDLNSLVMTPPVLKDNGKFRAKELSIAPINKKGLRLNLIESKDHNDGASYSVVQVAVVEDMGKSWEYGNIVFHPKDNNIPWIGGHASPGPLFSKNFINLEGNKLLGIINGREANTMVGQEIKYGIFSVGLFIYDYENGKIEWVSPKPFIRDSEAKIITFASQFIETGHGEGVLYAHVDDSFVRAYGLTAKKIKQLLPPEYLNK